MTFLLFEANTRRQTRSRQLTCVDLFRPFGQICQAEILRQLFAHTHEKQICNSIKWLLFFLFHFFSLFLSFFLTLLRHSRNTAVWKVNE